MSTFTRSGLFTPLRLCSTRAPAGISLPLFHGEDGLPLAVQIVGRRQARHRCLRSPAQLEEAQPWADRRAPLREGVPHQPA